MALGIFLVLVASATSQGASGTGGASPPPTGPGAAQTGAASDRALVKRMRLVRATWYGPGLYGNRTACGVRLGRSTYGVAHKRLPCGTQVTFFYRGRFKTVPVIDRGPFARGLRWDLTAATARELGFRQTGRLRVIH